jgi:hypothetical protein
MQIVYWAHSYRDEDAELNRHIGLLIEKAEQMIVNFDPPSKSVNDSKLAQNLRSCDGLVAVLSWRSTGPSPYILYEIGLALRARKPLIVFVDERLPSNILPPRILQQRYSHRLFFRQVRDHRYSLQVLKNYMGEQPPPRYQPPQGQRTCGLVGLGSIDKASREIVRRVVSARGFRLVDLEKIDAENPLAFEQFDLLATLDVALRCADSRTRASLYWTAALNAAAVPAITFTLNLEYAYDGRFPREFQPRLANAGAALSIEEVLQAELDLYEQEFLKIEDDPEAIERYTKMQLEARFLAGHYESDTRRQFSEVIMGDQYNVSGQAGAVGPNAHAHDMTFTQVWNQLESKLSLADLAQELQQLREAMERSATQPVEKLATGAVAAAEESAKQKDGPKVVEYLKTAGKWALSMAEKVGLDLAQEALKGALGL